MKRYHLFFKAISLIITTLLLAVGLAACGNSSNSKAAFRTLDDIKKSGKVE